MVKTVRCFHIRPDVPQEKLNSLLHIAFVATEAIHGQGSVRGAVEVVHVGPVPVYQIDVGTPMSRDLARVFGVFLHETIGDEAFVSTHFVEAAVAVEVVL